MLLEPKGAMQLGTPAQIRLFNVGIDIDSAGWPRRWYSCQDRRRRAHAEGSGAYRLGKWEGGQQTAPKVSMSGQQGPTIPCCPTSEQGKDVQTIQRVMARAPTSKLHLGNVACNQTSIECTSCVCLAQGGTCHCATDHAQQMRPILSHRKQRRLRPMSPLPAEQPMVALSPHTWTW